jgi:hypothetical protein
LEKAVEWLLNWAADSPLLVALIGSALVVVHYGPAYIKAISEAISVRRRDNVELSERENRLRKQIESRKRRQK